MKERPNRPYSKEDFIKAVNSINNSIPLEGRDAEEYLKILQIPNEDLEGKRILDFGSGNNLNFARQLSDEGIHAEVVSFSPALYLGKTWDNYAEGADTAGKLAVAGMGEELPFASASFDRVLAFYVTGYLQEENRMRAVLSEMVRVLKPGGKAYLGPIIELEKIREGASRKWLEEGPIKEITRGTANVRWKKTKEFPGGRSYTIHIVKNKEQIK